VLKFFKILLLLALIGCSEEPAIYESTDEPPSRYRFKTGSYIEATRNETFALCPPDKKTDGTWISEHSVALSAENCVSIQTPSLAGTIDILFMENSGRTDTIQVLVDQSYIQMGDYSHKIFVADTNQMDMNDKAVYIVAPGSYESMTYSQNLIVDKTMFIVADAHIYSKADTNVLPIIPYYRLEAEYKDVKLEESKLPLVNSISWRYANVRSKMEGLDTTYIRIHPSNAGKLILLGDPSLDYNSCETCTMIAVDTSASGYRVPLKDEWYFLMRAGASTRYYWGDEDMILAKKDSLVISSYEWIRPAGLKPVAQLLPNAFGLYDMAGIAAEACDNSPEGFFMCGKGIAQMIGPVNYKGFRLLRKTPKLQKLDKF